MSSSRSCACEIGSPRSSSGIRCKACGSEGVGIVHRSHLGVGVPRIGYPRRMSMAGGSLCLLLNTSKWLHVYICTIFANEGNCRIIVTWTEGCHIVLLSVWPALLTLGLRNQLTLQIHVPKDLWVIVHRQRHLWHRLYNSPCEIVLLTGIIPRHPRDQAVDASP